MHTTWHLVFSPDFILALDPAFKEELINEFKFLFIFYGCNNRIDSRHSCFTDGA